MIDVLRRIRNRAARTALRDMLVIYRHRGVSTRDTFLASYPRSGTTWLRFLLFETLTGEPADFDVVGRLLPPVGAHQDTPAATPSGGRIIQTHERWRRACRKALYLVRDPRDVVISQFAFSTRKRMLSPKELAHFDTYFENFLRGRVHCFGSWQAHVRDWIKSPLARNGNLLVVRYEDLRADTAVELGRILEFLGVPADHARIQQAIQNNTIDRMREKEDVSVTLPKLSQGQEDRRFVRSGALGGWKSRLTQAQMSRLERQLGDMMARVGYKASTTAGEDAVQLVNAG